MKRSDVAAITAFEPLRASSTPPSAAPNVPVMVRMMPRAPAEHGAGIADAAGEHCTEAIGVEHTRQQELCDLEMMAHEISDRPDELPQSCSHRVPLERLRRAVWRKQKERQDEHQKPHCRERTDQAVAFTRRRIERHNR